ncbi:hypothetical protein ANCDUO_12589 [Ancylostoma duodenale]|uniref:aECM cysteine-cradle domain-containing protein n=1 Tax=Ancylostoma duodenale TaxID=51022 RepID=A0A0C2D530_9BILA|nr:hypothetical protein ANCDUO_12589 [Ancylostoma duodenale]
MRVIAMLLICAASGYAFKERNPLKTKKYKCVEVAEDMEIQLVPKKESYDVERPDEELRLIGSASIARPPVAPVEDEEITMPQARKVPLKKHDAKVAPAPQVNQNVPRDKQGRPLLLSPAHCQQVESYASQYGVTDVLSWVERNCTFAKMFLPTATCAEINTLVASCYKMKYL